MVNYFKPFIVLVVFCFFYNTPVLGENLTIITPYWGTEENTYQNESYGVQLEDSQTMKGLFVQSVDPENYQWNIFLYQTDDINYSDLQGANFIYDWYYGDGSEKVFGIGLNYLKMDLDGEHVPFAGGSLDAFKLDMTIFSPYFRIGKYYKFSNEKWRYIVLPWVGAQVDYTEGTGLVDFPGYGSAQIQVDEDPFSWIAGVNFKLNYHHFLQLEAKHSVNYHDDHSFTKYSAIFNLFLTRNIGLSYRHNYHQTATGTDRYHIFGVAAIF